MSLVFKLPLSANIPWNIIDPKTELVALPGENPCASFCSGAPGGFSNYLSVNIPWKNIEDCFSYSSSKSSHLSKINVQSFTVYLVPIKDDEMISLTTKIEFKKRASIGSLTMENRRHSEIYDSKGNKRDPKREWVTINSTSTKKPILSVRKIEHPLTHDNDLKFIFKILATSGQHEKSRFTVLIVPNFSSNMQLQTSPVFLSDPIFVMTKKNNTGSQAVTTFVCDKINQAILYVQTQKASQAELDENGRKLIAESVNQLIELLACGEQYEEISKKRARSSDDTGEAPSSPSKQPRTSTEEFDKFPLIDLPLFARPTSSNQSTGSNMMFSSSRPIDILSASRSLNPFPAPSRQMDLFPTPTLEVITTKSFLNQANSFLGPTSSNSLRPVSSSSLGLFSSEFS